MSTAATPEQRLVFAVSPNGTGDGVPLVLVGIPIGAWDFMKDEHTHNFDLTKVGLPVKFILFGCTDRGRAIGIIEEANAARGESTLHMPTVDFSIELPARPANDEPGLSAEYLQDVRELLADLRDSPSIVAPAMQERINRLLQRSLTFG